MVIARPKYSDNSVNCSKPFRFVNRGFPLISRVLALLNEDNPVRLPIEVLMITTDPTTVRLLSAPMSSSETLSVIVNCAFKSSGEICSSDERPSKLVSFGLSPIKNPTSVIERREDRPRMLVRLSFKLIVRVPTDSTLYKLSTLVMSLPETRSHLNVVQLYLEGNESICACVESQMSDGQS